MPCRCSASSCSFCVSHIRQFDDNAWNNWKEILDKNSKTFWNDIKDKFISAEFQHAINVIDWQYMIRT